MSRCELIVLNNEKKILQNYLYNVSYQIVMTILPLATIPYLTRVLGSYNLGIARYTESVVQILTVFGLLGLVWYSNRIVAYNRQNEQLLSSCFWEIFFMRIILMVCTLVVFGAITLRSEYRDIFPIYVFYIMGTFLDTSWFFTGIEEMKPVVIRNYIVRIISTVLLFVLIRDRDDMVVFIWLSSLTMFANSIVIFPFLRSRLTRVSFRELNIYRHFLPSLALFLPQAATQIYVQCDKVLIKYMLKDPSFISFYTENEKIAKMPLVLATALSTVLMPRIAFEFKSGNKDRVTAFIRKAFLSIYLIIAPCCTGLMAVAKNFDLLFLGKEFADTYPLLIAFCPIMIFIGFSNVTGIQYLVALDRKKELTLSYVTAAVSNLIIDIILIPVIGLYGAVLGTLCAEIFAFVIQYHYMRRDLGSFHIAGMILWISIAAAIMGVIVGGLNLLPVGPILQLAIQVAAGVLVFLFLMVSSGTFKKVLQI